MAQKLTDLTVDEVSLVDRPANSEKGVPRARVALFKRDAESPRGKTEDGKEFPKSDYAYTPSDNVSEWKLRLTATPGAAPDARIVGAAVAALGEGFRGNKVEIPAEALKGVKAKVRAAWKAANPDKGSDELPDVLKVRKGESDMPMTLEMIEKKLTDQDAVLKSMTAERDVLKAENALVVKMSKKERKNYASMSEEERKEYLAGDADKRKTMMSKAQAARKEKAICDSMDEATKASFDKAGPNTRAEMLAAQKKKMKAKVDKKPTHDEPDGDEWVDDEEDYEKKKKTKKLLQKLDGVDDLAARVTKAEAELNQANQEARLQKFTKRAEELLPHTAGSPQEKGATLLKMADALGEDSEAFTKVLGQLIEGDKAMGTRFVELGKSGGTIPALKAFDAEVEKVAKRDNISIPKATERVMAEQPALYQEYEREQRHYAAAR